jgi:hypothetical protein
LRPYTTEEKVRRLNLKINKIDREVKKMQQHADPPAIQGEEEPRGRKNANTMPFDKVDNAIIAFVASKKEEDGPSQSEIVDEIQKKLPDAIGTSRVILLKRIKSLAKHNVLIGRSDPANRQTIRYYINKKSLLLQLDKYFNNFEDALIDLIQVFAKKHGGPITGDKPEEILFFTVIFELYQHVIGITMTSATFNWRKITNDPVLLNTLYTTLFAKLIRLQEKLSIALEEAGVDTYRNFVLSSWTMRPEVIETGIAVAQKYDLPHEPVNRVFDLAWSIGAPVARYARAKFEKGGAPPGGIGEIADDNNNAKIEMWNSRGGWKEAYLHWKEQQEQQQKK